MQQRFELRYDRWCGWLLGLLGMGARRSGVVVTEDAVDITMGWAFRLMVPRAAIRTVRHDDDRVLGWGVHGWRRRWLVNGSSDGLVRVEVDPAARGRVILLPWSVDTVRVSVNDPDGLVRALTGPDGAGAAARGRGIAS